MGQERSMILGMHLTPHDDELVLDAYQLGVRTIDTAPNYARFESHERLRALLERLGLMNSVVVHTKVGYRLDDSGGRVVHDVSAPHVRASASRYADDLGVPPAVLLHNPEGVVEGDTSLRESGRILAASCRALEDLRNTGAIRGWGISTWNAVRLLRIAQECQFDLPAPELIMARAGIFVGAGQLQAIETIRSRLDVKRSGALGMSPFLGGRESKVIRQYPSEGMLRGYAPLSRYPSAFRLAFELPENVAVAVSVRNRSQLRELVEGLDLEVENELVRGYRDTIALEQQTSY